MPILMVVGKFGDVPSSIRERGTSSTARLVNRPAFVNFGGALVPPVAESEFGFISQNQFWVIFFIYLIFQLVHFKIKILIIYK